MKTFILRCESFDTRASLEDRLRWVKAEHVLLVMPDQQPPALTRQDLIRLKRRASDLHASLGLVTSDILLQENARSAGLAVFNSKDEARQEKWRVEEPDRMWRHPDLAALRLKSRPLKQKDLPAWLRCLVFGLAVLAILALLAVLLPGGTVELNLPREEQSAELVVPARMDQPVPDLIAGIPLHELSLEVSATIEQKTTGSISIGDKPTTGVVIITNLTDQPLVIPTGTVVRSVEPAIRFSINKSGSLPAGPGTSISLPVTEMDGTGSLGNLPAGAIVAMDPPLGLSVSVTNPEAFSGGTQKSSPALAKADLVASEVALKETLDQAFMEKGPESLPDDARIIRESIVVDFVRSFDPPPPFDQPLTSFRLFNLAQMTGYYYLESELEQWASLALDASLDKDYLAEEDTLDVKIDSVDLIGSDQASFSINALRQTIPNFDSQTIADRLRGLHPAAAIPLIREQLIPGSQPEIQLSPSWWLWLPLIPERIHVDG